MSLAEVKTTCTFLLLLAICVIAEAQRSGGPSKEVTFARTGNESSVVPPLDAFEDITSTRVNYGLPDGDVLHRSPSHTPSAMGDDYDNAVSHPPHSSLPSGYNGSIPTVHQDSKSPKKFQRTYNYGVPSFMPSSRKDTQRGGVPEFGKQHIVTGIPDLGDPCFRRYADTIIVNAQPYERRSSISLVNCKTQCMSSQLGVYSCRSFVYDNKNQVCDLFPHVGDQTPARLLRFQSRDYFEPTAANNCSSTPLVAMADSLPSGPPIAQVGSAGNRAQSLAPNSLLLKEPVIGAGESSCGPEQVPRYMRTADFELHSHDDVRMESVSLEGCMDLCSNNFAASRLKSNATLSKCNSFEFNSNECILSHETAVPLGNGQLKQKSGTDYYEMILIGFAETVVDASSLQHCFDNCLNSRQLYNFQCTSGMFYFEEPQLNCILNTEDRTTQPDLFTGENSDLVDYFETGCNSAGMGALPSRLRSAKVFERSKDFVDEGLQKTRHESRREPARRSPPSPLGWAEWTPCASESPESSAGVQQRKRYCVGELLCGRETRPCRMLSRPMAPDSSTDKVMEAIRRSKCSLDGCCPIFGGCKVGVIRNPVTTRLEWCVNPCAGLKNEDPPKVA